MVTMSNSENRSQVDIEFLRETVRLYLEENNLSMAELGRALEPESNSVGWQSQRGKKFLNGKREITLRDLDHVASFMDQPITSLLKSPKYQVTMGDHSTNVVQEGERAEVKIGGGSSQSGQGDFSDYPQFLEYLAWKEATGKIK